MHINTWRSHRAALAPGASHGQLVVRKRDPHRREPVLKGRKGWIRLTGAVPTGTESTNQMVATWVTWLPGVGGPFERGLFTVYLAAAVMLEKVGGEFATPVTGSTAYRFVAKSPVSFTVFAEVITNFPKKQGTRQGHNTNKSYHNSGPQFH